MRAGKVEKWGEQGVHVCVTVFGAVWQQKKNLNIHLEEGSRRMCVAKGDRDKEDTARADGKDH